MISMAGALDNLGTLAVGLGHLPQARVWLEESLELQRPLGAPGYVTTLKCLGELARYEGNQAQARAYCEEALAMGKEAGLMNIFLLTLPNLGYVALQEGQWDEAAACFGEALSQFASTGRKYRAVYALEGLASLAARQSQPERAARLFAWAATARRANDLPLLPIEQAEVDRHLAMARAQLDAAAFEALWAEGQALTLEQATATALQTQTPLSP